MKKTIEMGMSPYVAAKKYGYEGNARTVFKDFEVDLDKLSPAARAIAEHIYTTDNGDDLSNLWVEGATQREVRQRVEELYARGEYEEIKAHGFFGNYEEDMKNFDNAEKVFGITPDKKKRILWSFDHIRGYETPEAYFERQAEEMRKSWGKRIVSGAMGKKIDFVL